ncbi:uncharacterized protein B0H64DRAFT_192035 [Chaetomium fimeti]|uniref:Uncharacterized protein n=1 Tax=Chaetomium fimeti TaxID=1854472 RepID=A0AAE0HE29_9PEZI|nr:hypothetical protein B0H64DRAFT_192035 [Chaetomium fimeti]
MLPPCLLWMPGHRHQTHPPSRPFSSAYQSLLRVPPLIVAMALAWATCGDHSGGAMAPPVAPRQLVTWRKGKLELPASGQVQIEVASRSAHRRCGLELGSKAKSNTETSTARRVQTPESHSWVQGGWASIALEHYAPTALFLDRAPFQAHSQPASHCWHRVSQDSWGQQSKS